MGKDCFEKLHFCHRPLAVTLLLFFAVNPIYSIILGAFAGKHIKAMRSLPVIAALVFLLGSLMLYPSFRASGWCVPGAVKLAAGWLVPKSAEGVTDKR